jgi:hypothetical protein
MNVTPLKMIFDDRTTVVNLHVMIYFSIKMAAPNLRPEDFK